MLEETYRPPADLAAPRVGDMIVLSPGQAPIAAYVKEILPPEREGDAGTLFVDRPFNQ